MRSNALPLKMMTWKTSFLALALLVSTSMSTGCSKERPAVFYTGSDYLVLNEGQIYISPRHQTLATESVIQSKDQMILDLQRANEILLRELEDLRSR